MLQDQVITIWAVIYDQSPTRIYIFTNWQSVLKAISGSLLSYLDEFPRIDEMTDQIIDWLKDRHEQPYIPIRANHLVITISRYELDNSTQIHKVLHAASAQVDPQLKLQIESLFSDSAYSPEETDNSESN